MDYLQLLSGRGDWQAQGNRTVEVSQVSRGLKALAKELDVPVLALCQLSREVDRRERKRPELADLRESGSIEHDSDVVMFVYRREYYLGKEEPEEKADEDPDNFGRWQAAWEEKMAACGNQAELIVAKQRHGPLGTLNLRFNPARTTFSDDPAARW